MNYSLPENNSASENAAVPPRPGTFCASAKVSIVIPAYNIAPYIAETLASVFAQSYRNFEVIVVNDGSPDTEKFEREIEPFRDRIVYLKKENGGAASARNSALRAATGELIAFLDGDDVWLPEFLQSQIAFLQAETLDMAYADASFFGENADESETYMQFSVSEGEVTTESLLAWKCNVITSGTIVKREKLFEAGLFDESSAWRRGQDFEMWFRLAKRRAKIGYQRRVLLKYRIRRGSLTGNNVQLAERNVTVLRGIEDKYELTESEREIWEYQLARSQAMFEIEKGKSEILRGEFQAARRSFANANRFYRKPKLSLVGVMLMIAPRIIQRFIERQAAQLTQSHADVL